MILPHHVTLETVKCLKHLAGTGTRHRLELLVPTRITFETKLDIKYPDRWIDKTHQKKLGPTNLQKLILSFAHKVHINATPNLHSTRTAT